jgi:hypothetical protein
LGLLKYILGQTDAEIAGAADGPPGVPGDDLAPLDSSFARAEAAIDQAARAHKSNTRVSDRRSQGVSDRRGDIESETPYFGADRRSSQPGDRRHVTPGFGKRNRTP